MSYAPSSRITSAAGGIFLLIKCQNQNTINPHNNRGDQKGKDVLDGRNTTARRTVLNNGQKMADNHFGCGLWRWISLTIHNTNTREKAIACLIALVMVFQLAACGVVDTTKNVASSAKDTAVAAKDAIIEWYEGIDLSAFKDGWDAAVGFAGSAYASALSSEYVANIGSAINDFKISMNSAAGSARGIAQEAGFAAEKWAAGTFNIDATANESAYHAEVVGSNGLGSVDVTTNYGEEASLKYYGTSSGSARAQATTLIEAYTEYAHNSSDPMSLQEYMKSHGYDYKTQNKLLPLYDGQTRIIPSDQIPEAVDYLNGRITKLSTIEGPEAEQLTKTYQQTLDNLKDRLTAPDGTTSKPATYEEMQAVAELSQNGEFKPEDFGFAVSDVITPKVVMKQAVGTGLEVGLLKTVFAVGPDLVSIIIEAVKSGALDEDALKDTGIEGAVAMSSGFVEGSVSRVVVTLCEAGTLGEALKGASPNVIGALVFLTIEAMISGYSLAKGDITAEEYGCLMADKTMITALAIPTSALLISVLPGTKLFMLAGCLAGGIIASTGYTLGKEAVLEFVDGGGFEAIVPTNVGKRIESAKEAVSKLNISEQWSNLKQFTVSTVDEGIIKVKGILE